MGEYLLEGLPVDAFFVHHLALGYPFNHDLLAYFGPSVHVFKHPYFLPVAWFLC